MSRTLFTFLERQTDPENLDLVGLNTPNLRLEILNLGTWTTASGGPTSTIPVRETSGFATGDTIYVGLEDLSTVASVSVGSGPGNIIINETISFGINITVALKNNGVSNQFEPVFDDPTFETARTQPMTPDTNNQVIAYIRSARFVRRWFNSATATTLEIGHDFTTQETDAYQVSRNVDTPTAGLDEVVRKIDTGALGGNALTGGKVLLGSGTFLLMSTWDITGENLLIEGMGPSTVLQGDASLGRVLSIDGSADLSNGIKNVVIRNLRIRAGQGASTSLLQLSSCSFGVTLENVILDAGGFVWTGAAIQLLNCRGVSIFNPLITGGGGVGSFGRAFDIDNAVALSDGGNTNIHGGRVQDVVQGALIASTTAQDVPGVAFYGTDFLGAPAASEGVQCRSLSRQITLDGCRFDGFVDGVEINGAKSVSVKGCRIANGTNGIRVTVNGGIGILSTANEFEDLDIGHLINAGDTHELLIFANNYLNTPNQISNASTAVSENSIIIDDDEIILKATDISLLGDVAIAGRVTPGTFLNVTGEELLEISGTPNPGQITPTTSNITVDTFQTSLTDELHTILPTNAVNGDLLTMRALTSARLVRVEHAVGNISLLGGSDFIFRKDTDRLFLIFDVGTGQWEQQGRVHEIQSDLLSSFMKFPTQDGFFNHQMLGGSGDRIDLTVDIPAMSDASYLDITSDQEGSFAGELDGIENGVNGQMIWLKVKNGNVSDVNIRNGITTSNGDQILLNAGTRLLSALKQNAILLRFSDNDPAPLQQVWMEVAYMPES